MATKSPYNLLPREPEDILTDIIEEELARNKNYDEIPEIDISEEIQQTSSHYEDEAQQKQYALVPTFRRLTVTENNYIAIPKSERFSSEEQSQIVVESKHQGSLYESDFGPIPKLANKVNAIDMNDKGVEFSNEGNLDQAVALFTAAIALDSSNPEIFCNRGMAYRSWGKLELAIKDFDEALKLKADHVEARYRRGFCYFELKNFKLAKEDFATTLEKDPNHVWAYYLRGRIHMAVKKYDRARKDFQEAKKIAAQQNDAGVLNLATKMLATAEEKYAKKHKKVKSFF